MKQFIKKLLLEKISNLFNNGISASMLCLYSIDKIKFFENYSWPKGRKYRGNDSFKYSWKHNS